MYEELIYPWDKDIRSGDLCERGSQLRPHVVWFGEPVPMMEPAAEMISMADIAMIIGTSMQVYPAAGLIRFAPSQCVVYYIDPRPQINFELSRRGQLNIISEKAGSGVPAVVADLLDH